jgi:hypothetical protein
MFTGVYWGGVDGLSHVYGPDDERPAAEFEHFTEAFERYFIRELEPAIARDTLVILVADHGQLFTPKDPHYTLKQHPSLARRLAINPTGENRLPYFNIRSGQMEAVREYLDRRFMQQFIQLDPGYAVEHRLFGPGEPHPRLRDRIGDLLAVPRGNAYLWWADKENPIVGRHGGLSSQEMLVPFLAARLG